MDETSRNSAKLDIEGVRQQSVSDALRADSRAKESYKQIGDADINRNNSTNGFGDVRSATNGGASDKSFKMPRENGTGAKEGEDERMLNGGDGGVGATVVASTEEASEKDKLAQKEVEVKFISSPNGDARIDLEVESQQTFSGMTKEELMKYANDPFWVRLRWLLFVLFWGLWVAMLLGSFYIIYDAPKCSAPVPLSWWQQGPLIEIDETQYESQVETIAQYGAKGVVYRLPANETYFIDSDPVKEKLEKLIATFRSKKIEVVIDITPNFVTAEDPLYKTALEKGLNDPASKAFVWNDRATLPNWLSVTEPGSAFKNVTATHAILSQFGPGRFDLQLNETIAKEKLKNVLKNLIVYGFRGVRLANAKHFIISNSGNEEVMPSTDTNKALTIVDYGFWTHARTTYVSGLGELFHELAGVVHGELHENGFLSVTEDILRPEVFAFNGTLPIDIPLYGNIEYDLREANNSNATRKLHHDIENTYAVINQTCNSGKPWLQLRYNNASLQYLGASEYTIFNFLLPGVPLFALDVLTANNVTKETIETLEKFRASPSFQHGQFAVYHDEAASTIAYIRLKSGNPGYFVALNLDPVQEKVADFGGIPGIGAELTVVLTSNNYAVPDVAIKTKVPVNAVRLSPKSAIIATYVPAK
uniref:Putative cd98hc amino acid transporter protein n=1 Tax=Anopheles marajoara TaxID=58244 RepID=A0A2M4BGT7_9DIPT